MQESSTDKKQQSSQKRVQQQILALLQQPSKHHQIQIILVSNQDILHQRMIKKILLMTKSKVGFHYSYLATALSLKNQKQYNSRFNIIYQMLNAILKMSNLDQHSTNVHTISLQFFYFLLHHPSSTFLQTFPKAHASIKENIIKYPHLTHRKIEMAPRTSAKLFSSFLCFKFISPSQILKLLSSFVTIATDPSEFLNSIEHKLIKKLADYQGQLESSQVDFLVGQYKLEEMHQEEEVKQGSFHSFLHQNKRLVVFLLKESLCNRKLENRVKLMSKCLSLADPNSNQVFELIAQKQWYEEDLKISSLLFQFITKQSQKYLSVSRIKALLKRIDIKPQIPVKLYYQKIENTLDLLTWISKKFNSSLPIIELKQYSYLQIKNLSKVSTIIFAADFEHNCFFQFKVGENVYKLSLRKSVSENAEKCNLCIDVNLNDKNKILEQKKVTDVGKFIVCILSVSQQKNDYYLKMCINQNFVKIVKSKYKQISGMKIGQFSGTVKEIFCIDKPMDPIVLYKNYVEKYRKMDEVLKEMGEQKFVFTLQKSKNQEIKKRFWKKQMGINFQKCNKLYSVSFTQAVEQIGGMSSLLYLFSKIFLQEGEQYLKSILIQLLDFIQTTAAYGDYMITGKWVYNSTHYLGQFLWLMVNNCKNLGRYQPLFTRIFNLFDWFSVRFEISQKRQFILSIIKNICLNFELWSLCSKQIVFQMIVRFDSFLKDQAITKYLLTNDHYQDIMSSLIFFMNGSENTDKYKNFTLLGQKICDFHQICDPSYIKRDINIVFALMTSIINADKKSFTRSETQILMILIRHFKRVFIQQSKIEKSEQIWVYLIYQIGAMMSECPKDFNILSELVEFGFSILNEVKIIKKSIKFIFTTIFQSRKDDTFQDTVRIFLCFLKKSKILNSLNKLTLRQIMHDFLIGIIDKGKKDEQINVDEIKIEQDLIEIEKGKLFLLTSNNLFGVLLLDFLEKKGSSSLIIYVVYKIVYNDWFPHCSDVFISCIDRIYDQFRSLKNIISQTEATILSRQIQLAEGNVVQDEKMKVQNEHNNEIIEKETVAKEDKENSKGRKQEIQKDEQNSQQQGKQFSEDKDQLGFSKIQTKQESKGQKLVESQQKLAKISQETNLQTLEVLRKKLQKLSSYLSQLFANSSLKSCLRYCRSEKLLYLILSFGCFEDSGKPWAFKLPMNSNIWKQNEKQYGGDLGTVLTWNALNFNEISILKQKIKKKKDQKLTQSQNFMEKSTESDQVLLQNVTEQFFCLFLIYHTLNILSQTDTSHAKVQQLKRILKTATKTINISFIMRIWKCIKVHKIKIQKLANNQQFQKAEQLQILSKKLVQVFQANHNQEQNLRKSLYSFLLKNCSIQSQKGQKIGDKGEIYRLKIKQILDDYLLLQQAFSKNNNIQIECAVQEDKNKNLAPGKGKEKKEILISDILCYSPYSENLKGKMKMIYIKAKKQSQRRQKEWESLLEKNEFWQNKVIKNNEVYEVDPKLTGFYRLNIIKNKVESFKYPRRRSFKQDNELENCMGEDKIESGSTVNSNLELLFTKQEILEMSKVMEAKANLKKQSVQQNKSKSFLVQYVTQKGVYAGQLKYNQKKDSFIFKCNGYESLPQSPVYQLSTVYHRIEDKQFKIEIQLNSKSQIFTRRYVLRHTGIEIFTFNKSYFFNLFYPKLVAEFFSQFRSKISCIENLREQFEKRGFTEKWQKGIYDNFEYLMLLNKYSGRTFNDLVQYPVFPWVIINYSDTECQVNQQFIENKKNMRDLAKPSGMLNEEKIRKLRERCMEMGDEDKQMFFLYGTMYSNPTVLYNFFIRLEPFIGLHWEHQGQKIDHADRLFSSIKEQFATVLSSSTDNKELTPQFYYWAEFLKNRNKVDLGVKQNKEEVHSVKLPGWAHSPQEFVFRMRQALESPQVTNNLHSWIDLIFGYKNPRDVAFQHNNLFHFRCYEHDIFETEEDEVQIRSAQITITQFGQVPYPLFPNKQHPQKQGRGKLKIDKHIEIKSHLEKDRILKFSLSDRQTGLLYIFYSNRIQIFGNNIKGMRGNKKIVETFESLSFPSMYRDRQDTWVDLCQGYFKVMTRKQRLLSHEIKSQVYILLGRKLIFGFGSQLVVCLISDSLRELDKIQSLYGHKNTIIYIDVSQNLDLILSMDQDGLVLLHQLASLKMLRQINLGINCDILSISIHQMGYFIFLTKSQKLIIYTYLAQLFLEQDIEIKNNKGGMEKITTIQILTHNSSHLLFGTNKGNIFSVDFLHIKRFNENLAFKTYSRIKFSQNCIFQMPRQNDTEEWAVKEIKVSKISGDNNFTYRLFVLFENNALYSLIEEGKVIENVKNNKNLGFLNFITKHK